MNLELAVHLKAARSKRCIASPIAPAEPIVIASSSPAARGRSAPDAPPVSKPTAAIRAQKS